MRSQRSLVLNDKDSFCFKMSCFLVQTYLHVYWLQSELEIEPRYPLFGGWKSTFVIGYGLPLQDFLFESPDGRRYLNFTFGCPLVETVVDKLIVKVGLLLLTENCASTASVCNSGGLIYPSCWTIKFQVVLPEGSKDPTVEIPFEVKQHLEVMCS